MERININSMLVFIKDFFLKEILILVGMFTSVLCFKEYFDIRFSNMAVSIMIVFTVLTMSIVFNVKYGKFILPSTLIIWIVYIAVCFDAVKDGAILTINRMIIVSNTYFGTNIDKINVSSINTEVGTAFTCFICAVLFMYAFFLVISSWKKLIPVVHIMLSLVFVTSGMIVGELPGQVLMTMIVMYYVLCVISGGRKHMSMFRIASIIGLIVITAVIVSTFSGAEGGNSRDKLNKYKSKINSFIKKTGLEDFQISSIENLLSCKSKEIEATGGMNSGRLGEVDTVKFSNRTMLNVKVSDCSNSIYLKGFVSLIYNDSRWESLNTYYSSNSVYSPAEVSYELMNAAYNMIDQSRERNITINIKGAEKKYKFFPYFSDLSGERTLYGATLYADTKMSYDYNFKDYSYNDYIVNGPYVDNAITDYVVRETSLEIPENVSMLFDKILVDAPKYNGGNLDECVNYVKTYLSENAKYSLSPGAKKKGVDFIEDFLVNKKEGYCVHFATSATEMFRYMGIPSRYVEGYVVKKSELDKSKSDSNGIHSVNVTDKSAHAWTEIYVSGLGFIPVETTPGYSGETQSDPKNDKNKETSSKTEKETTTVIKETTTSETTTHMQTTKGNETGSDDKVTTASKNESGNSLMGILIASAVVLIAIILVVIFGKKRNEKIGNKNAEMDINRAEILRQSDRFKKCMKHIKITYDIGVSSKEICKEITDRVNTVETKYADKPDRLNSLKQLDKEAYDILEIFEKAYFSDENAEFSLEEVDKVSHYVEKFKNSLQYLKNRL